MIRFDEYHVASYDARFTKATFGYIDLTDEVQATLGAVLGYDWLAKHATVITATHGTPGHHEAALAAKGLDVWAEMQHAVKQRLVEEILGAIGAEAL